MSINMNNSFVVKYAPKQLSEVVLADVDVERAIKRYASRQDMRPLILYGPNGTGKSTVARLLAQELFSGLAENDIHELDPFRLLGEQKTRTSIYNHISMCGFGGDGRCLILDEFNLFPKGIIQSIKSAIDQYTKNVLFIATTNDLSALDLGHRSRSVCLQIVQPPLERWMPRIVAILNAEGASVPKDQSLMEMLQDSGGDNRQFLTNLQLYVEELGGAPAQAPSIGEREEGGRLW